MRVLKAIGLIGFGVMLGVGGAIHAAATPQAVVESRLKTSDIEYAGNLPLRFIKDTQTGQCYLAGVEGGKVVTAITPTDRNACTF